MNGILNAYRPSDFYDQLNTLNYKALVRLAGNSVDFSCLEPMCKSQDKVREKRKALLVDRLINYLKADPTAVLTCSCGDLLEQMCCNVDYATFAATNEEVADVDDITLALTSRAVSKETGADLETIALQDGSRIGQKHNIRLVTDGGGDCAITPVTASNFTTVTLADAGDFVDLEWTVDGWIIIGLGGLTAPPVVTA